MSELRATEQSQLVAINKRIHDRWFNVEDVRFDAIRNIVTVPFVKSRSASKAGESLIPSYLDIANVERYTLKESEGVGRYDFNEVEFSEPIRTVTITTGIPLTFAVVVRDLDVRVREAERKAASALRRSTF